MSLNDDWQPDDAFRLFRIVEVKIGSTIYL